MSPPTATLRFAAAPHNVRRLTPPATAADQPGNLCRPERQPIPTSGAEPYTRGGNHDRNGRRHTHDRLPLPHERTAAGNRNESERFDTHVVSV